MIISLKFFNDSVYLKPMADANKKKGNPIINFIKVLFYRSFNIGANWSDVYITIFIVEFIAGCSRQIYPNGLLPGSLAIKFLALN